MSSFRCERCCKSLKMVLWYGSKLKCYYCGFIGLPFKGEEEDIPEEKDPEPQSNTEDEQLRDKVVTLREKCSELTHSIDTVHADYSTLLKTVRQLKASIVKSKVIQEAVTKLATLDDYMTEYEIQRTRQQIKKLQAKLSKALKVKDQIAEKKMNPNFLDSAEIQAAEMKISQSETLLKSIQLPIKETSFGDVLKDQAEARGELECVICLEVPLSNSHVFSCNEHHLLCQECKNRSLVQCPVCRQSFGTTPPARNRLAEKLIEKLMPSSSRPNSIKLNT